MGGTAGAPPTPGPTPSKTKSTSSVGAQPPSFNTPEWFSSLPIYDGTTYDSSLILRKHQRTTVDDRLFNFLPCELMVEKSADDEDVWIRPHIPNSPLQFRWLLLVPAKAAPVLARMRLGSSKNIRIPGADVGLEIYFKTAFYKP